VDGLDIASRWAHDGIMMASDERGIMFKDGCEKCRHGMHRHDDEACPLCACNLGRWANASERESVTRIVAIEAGAVMASDEQQYLDLKARLALPVCSRTQYEVASDGGECAKCGHAYTSHEF
jgi:hypothetical protein